MNYNLCHGTFLLWMSGKEPKMQACLIFNVFFILHNYCYKRLRIRVIIICILRALVIFVYKCYKNETRKLDADISTLTTLHWPWCLEHSTQASLVCLRLPTYYKTFWLFLISQLSLVKFCLFLWKSLKFGQNIIWDTIPWILRYYKPM